MRGRKGFTLIELMVVVVIVAILAAIIVPLLLSRVERSKYAEGKAIASQVATALRAHVSEMGPGTYTLEDMGFEANELDGKYFDQDDISISAVSIADGALTYTISLTPRSGLGLDHGDLTMECTDNNTLFIAPVGY